MSRRGSKEIDGPGLALGPGPRDFGQASQTTGSVLAARTIQP